MRDARFAGRVGGWAVALGVGAAVACAPGVAWAQPDAGTTAKDTPSTTRHETARAEKASETPKTDLADKKPSRTSRNKAGAASKTEVGDEGPTLSRADGVKDTDTSSTIIRADDHATLDDDDAAAAAESVDTTSATHAVEAVASQEPAGTPAAAAPEHRSAASILHNSAPAPVMKEPPAQATKEPPTSGGAEGATELLDTKTVDLDGGVVAPTDGAGPSNPAAGDVAAPSLSAQLVDTVNPTAEPSGLATGLIAATLHPFGGYGPAQPAQTTMLWGLMEWARREFLPDNKTPTLMVQATEQIDEDDVIVGMTGFGQGSPTLSYQGGQEVNGGAVALSAVTTTLPTTVLTLAGAFSSSDRIPPQLQGEITAGNTVVPVLYNNSDVLGWLFGGETRPQYIADGVQKLNAAINATAGPKLVFGDSLGAVVAQYWLAQYGETSTVPADELRFVLIGNSIRKYGGRLRTNHLAVANAVQVPDVRYPVLDIARQWDIWADYPLITTSPWYSAALNNAKAGNRSPYTLHADYKNVDPDPDAPGNTKLIEGNWTYVWSRTNDLPLFYSAWNRFVYGVSGMTADQRDQLWRPRIESAHLRPMPLL